MMLLPIVLATFLLFINDGITPSAEASIIGSSCSQHGIIEKHNGKLLCMCNGKEVKQDQYCQKGMIFSVQSGLLEITITRGNDSAEQLNTPGTESLAHKTITQPIQAIQARPIAITRGIQSIEKEPPATKALAFPNQCFDQ